MTGSNDTPLDDLRNLDRMLDNSVSHQKVLRSLKHLRIQGYEMLIEEQGNRLEFPNEYFQQHSKAAGQRKRSLCYPDAVLHTQREPRVLLEVIDNSPVSPNGITGLIVNVDRCAQMHRGIDLVLIVLAQMKEFYCSYCRRGHRVTNTQRHGCLQRYQAEQRRSEALLALLHEGKPESFKKTLLDYPITDYLRNMRPPVVLFLSAARVSSGWERYEAQALRLIEQSILQVLATEDRHDTLLQGVDELMPDVLRTPTPLPNNSAMPPPGTRVTWTTPSGQHVVFIKNRGRRNTRVLLTDGSAEKVPNTQLFW